MNLSSSSVNLGICFYTTYQLARQTCFIIYYLVASSVFIARSITVNAIAFGRLNQMVVHSITYSLFLKGQ